MEMNFNRTRIQVLMVRRMMNELREFALTHLFSFEPKNKQQCVNDI
jgi:hypothetical protein